MPRYYCDYCDTYLTHDSPSVRKQHNAGYKHKANVRSYYQQFEEQQTQSLIDQRIKEHLGQAAAFQGQVGATFNQHLMSFPPNAQRPRLPILPGGMPMGVSPLPPMGVPLLPGVRPPVLPRPGGLPAGYGPTVPSMAPPGAPVSLQMNNLPRPPTLMPPASIGPATSTSNDAATMANPVMYQTNPPSATAIGYNPFPSASGVQSAASGAPALSVTATAGTAPTSETSH